MWPGRIIAIPNTPMVMNNPDSNTPGANNMWPGRMLAPTSVPMVTIPSRNLLRPNNMSLHRMPSARSGLVPEQRQRELNIQRDDDALRDSRCDHEGADERLTYLQRELATEEQQVATLTADTHRMMHEGLESEESR